MYCIHCGTQLPEEAKFCFNCGKPPQGSVPAVVPTPPPNELPWETCEIVFEIVKKPAIWGDSDLKFWGSAIGPKGAYSAGELVIFKGLLDGPDASKQTHISALNQLIQALTADGWEPVGRGSAWFNQRFQRRQAQPAPVPDFLKTIVDVLLLDCGPRKIEVIKAIRELTGLGLKEAKDIADLPGSVVLRGVSRQEAARARIALEEAGGKVGYR